MSLIYNEEQQLLRDSARAFLNQNGPVARLRSARDTRHAGGVPDQLWRQMADMGWAGIVIGEEHGGLDFGFIGAGVLCEEMGRTLTVAPLLSSALVSATLLRAMGSAAQRQLLESIATGDVTVAPALDERPRHDLRATATRATRTDSGYRLDGRKTLVPDGCAAGYLLVLARSAAEPGAADGLGLFLVKADSAGVGIERTQLADHHDWAEIRLNAVKVTADALVGGEGKAYGPVDACLDRARICVAAMLLGISSEVFERTLAYVKERKQFGVPVGSFQALQHRAAQLFCEIELLKSLVLRALQAADEGAEELPLLASAAKTKACRTARLAVNEAVQMHGGMGMTDEFDIGFFMKRAASLQQLYGDSYAMEDRFASLKDY